MPFIETKHTFAAVDKIKKDLTKFLKIINNICLIVFFFYYIYLIYTNYKSPFYLSIYVILFITLFSTFLVEVLIKGKTSDSRKKQRIKLERKRLIKGIIKIVKYLAKFITVCIALYDLLYHEWTSTALIANLASIVILGIQLIAEFVVHYLNKYIDYIKLSVELDIEASSAAKLMMRKQMKSEKLENQVSVITGKDTHTNQENKIISRLKESAEVLKKEREEKLNLNIEKNKQEIKNYKIKLKQKKKTEKKNKIA